MQPVVVVGVQTLHATNGTSTTAEMSPDLDARTVTVPPQPLKVNWPSLLVVPTISPSTWMVALDTGVEPAFTVTMFPSQDGATDSERKSVDEEEVPPLDTAAGPCKKAKMLKVLRLDRVSVLAVVSRVGESTVQPMEYSLMPKRLGVRPDSSARFQFQVMLSIEVGPERLVMFRYLLFTEV